MARHFQVGLRFKQRGSRARRRGLPLAGASGRHCDPAALPRDPRAPSPRVTSQGRTIDSELMMAVGATSRLITVHVTRDRRGSGWSQARHALTPSQPGAAHGRDRALQVAGVQLTSDRVPRARAQVHVQVARRVPVVTEASVRVTMLSWT
eukprot:1033168-Rhodomonas_salina.2